LSEFSSRTDDATDRVRDIAQQASEKAREAGAAVQQRVSDEVDERSTTMGQQAGQVSQAVRDMSAQLSSQGNDLPARAADELASRVEQLARYLRESDGERIMNDLEEFGRRQPLIVAAVGLAAGVAAARLLKASGGRSHNGASRDAPGSERWTGSTAADRSTTAPVPYGSAEPQAPPYDAPPGMPTS
jgi:hypothetical protein